MHSVGSSSRQTTIRSSSFDTRPSSAGSPEGSSIEDDDLVLALMLQLEELGIEVDTRKGKERAGSRTDRNAALTDFKDTLEGLSTFHSDRRMAQSMAVAVHQDAVAITELVAVEAIAVRDREQVLREENMSFRATLATDFDDTASVFTDFEQHTNLPSYVFEYHSEDDESGPSSKPQIKGIQYYTGRKITCSICVTSVPHSNTIKCPCNHIYCSDCLRKYIQNAMKDESMYPLKCCRLEVPNQILSQILSPREYQEYINKGIEYSTANRLYCANKKCLKFISPDMIDEVAQAALCGSCGTAVCTLCKNEEHAGLCRKDEGLEAVMLAASQNGWRQCFKCQRMIELQHGCHHMTCHCKAEFCYVCGVEWKKCNCALFEENRLYDAAAVRVDRDAVVPLAPVIRAERIEQVQEQIRENHNCTHPGRFEKRTAYRSWGYQCDICNRRHWKYILVCPRCELMACEECRRFRV
ncbi:hypothetical protein TWF694_008461 [Orbilia ellipsospora]|uniref:RBR-type E3 ubiquitin transferase n=1 Tax=Orbilia ellipsospora TaxID=2528407 RepID=A0AAV9XG54_9PEZI